MTCYVYDGEGRRVQKIQSTATTTYVYDATGNLAAEYGTPTDHGTKFLLTDHLGSTRVLVASDGISPKRYDYLPFGEEIQAGTDGRGSEYSSGMYPSPAGLQSLEFTGKERDAETGLDYFGARYFSGAQARFTTSDPKQMTSRHLIYPQKWNKYAYVQNNPLTSVDPDGLDDYKVFITDALGGGGNWSKAEAAAKANGHTMEIRRGKDATIGAYNKALSEPNSRVIFVGHVSHDPATLKTTAVQMSDMGRSAGANSVQSVLGPPDANGVRNATEVPLPTTTVAANTVGIFGCQSIDLAPQYPGANFVGVDSGTGSPGQPPVSSLEALGAAAAAFAAADAAARPASGQPAPNAIDPVTASNQAFQQNKHKEDLDGDKVKKP